MSAGASPSRRTARLAGGLYLSLIPLGFFSFVYVPSVVVAREDVRATVRGLLASERLFRLGIVSHLASQVIVVFLLLTLYRLLRGVNRDRALLMLVLGLPCVPVSFLSEVNSLEALRVATGLGGGTLAAAQVPELVALSLDRHRSAVLLAQVFWALWMLPLAALIHRSGFLPRWLSIPVLIAAAGYLLDSGAHLLAPQAAPISGFTALGELPLPLWLLIRGVRWLPGNGAPAEN